MDVVKKLADERLLVTSRVGAEEETVEVSHEALIRQWQRVQEWLNEDREFLLWRERLRGHVNDWQYNTQDEGALLRGAPLVEAQRWLSQRADMLMGQEEDYIRQSAEARERTVQAEKQRAEHELAQAKRLVEEAERAREAEAWRAEAAERSRRRQKYFSLALLSLFLVSWIVIWLWLNGYGVAQVKLKVQSFFGDIHVAPEMIPIPGGSFKLGKYEVTFDEYDRFAVATGRRLPEDYRWGRGRRPVISVTWDDATAYADWLSKKTRKRYRLPTIAEWEYSAQGGAKQSEWAGTSNESQLEKYAVLDKNSEGKTAEVGTKLSNGFGLYDMSGNVWEWVTDCSDSTESKNASKDGSVRLEANSSACSKHVIVGGSFYDTSENARFSHKPSWGTDRFDNDVGFRLAQDLEP